MIFSDLYYFAKPVIPLRWRLTFRRALAGYLRSKHDKTWPINEGAGAVPDNWKGWPQGKKFAFVLTHDVEGRRGFDRSRLLANLDMEYGFRSSFNFVPEGEYRVPDELRSFMTSNGFEIGVHDLHHDGSLYRSAKQFRSACKKINEYVETWGAEGFRSGFMRHNLQWLGALETAYDSSTFDTDPFEPQPDGVETIFPFWVWKDGKHGYVELPYTLPQDSTLFLLFKERSIDLWKRKLDWVAAKGGMALVNVHPDYINFQGDSHLGEYSCGLYRDLLDYVRKQYSEQCWFALPREVARHFYGTMIAGTGVNKRLEDQQSTQSQSREHNLLAEVCPVAASNHVLQPREISCLQGKRMVAVSFSSFPGDPRPRRAAEAFCNAGMKVEVICLSDEGSPKRESFKGIEIERIPLRHHRGSKVSYILRYCLFILIVLTKLAMRSLTRRYDVVHIHNMPDVLVFAALFPKLLGAKVILDLHDPMPELMMTIFNLRKESRAVKLMTVLEKWSIAFADAVLTVNRACEKLFFARGCPASKITVVMNSPDENIFRYVPARMGNADRRDRPFIIMYHGTLVERNGVDLAVEALAKVRQFIPAAELRIYGPWTPFLEQVMSTVTDKGLEKAVHYLGARRLEGLVEAITECDVGVIPNKRSIFTEINTPTRIFEYLSLGKPVVAPSAPGILDYFDKGELVLFELGNVDNLAQKLEWVATHPVEAFEITQRGQEVYRSHSWCEEEAKLRRMTQSLLVQRA